MSVDREVWLEWREARMTQMFLAEVERAATEVAKELLERSSRDGDRDLYLRGVLNGLSQASGWMPELTVEEGEKPIDALLEEQQ